MIAVTGMLYPTRSRDFSLWRFDDRYYIAGHYLASHCDSMQSSLTSLSVFQYSLVFNVCMVSMHEPEFECYYGLGSNKTPVSIVWHHSIPGGRTVSSALQTLVVVIHVRRRRKLNSRPLYLRWLLLVIVPSLRPVAGFKTVLPVTSPVLRHSKLLDLDIWLIC